MPDPASEPVLVLASETELPAVHRVWGTGGWLAPEEREALDWLTLARLLGWGVRVTRRADSGLDARPSGGSRCVIIACDPDQLGAEPIACLASWLAAEPILVVIRAGASDRGVARLTGVVRKPDQQAGRHVRWIGPGEERRWSYRQALEAAALEASRDTSTWATLEGAPLIVARRAGRGVVATLGFQPSRARDADGAGSALLKHLLIAGSPGPVAWLDLEGSLVLRMDDPGGAQNVHSRSWAHPKLGEAEWAAIGGELERRNGRLSIGYVAGWVDDGDPARGVLRVHGHVPGRRAGGVYPSPEVSYHDLAGHAPGSLHGYQAEFRGIQALRAAGLGEVELHGYTHMHPDGVAWAQAPDRYETEGWYRELGPAAAATIAARPPDQHPLALGMAALRRYFGIRPTTLICPGDQWTNDVLERAADLGLSLVGGYYLSLRDGERFCWTQHVCAPYLDEPDAGWFASGLPVVGYFHDRDAALQGVGWVGRWLDRWQAAGAQKLMDFRELAAALGRRLHLDHAHGELHLTVRGQGEPGLVRPLSVGIRLPEGRLPARVSASLDDGVRSLEVHPLGDGVGRVGLPRSAERPAEPCAARGIISGSRS